MYDGMKQPRRSVYGTHAPRGNQMTNTFFIANMIDERETQQQLEEAWHRILDVLPEDTPNVTRKQPHLTLRFLGTQCEDETKQTKQLQQLDYTLQEITKGLEPIKLVLGYIHTFPGVAWVSVGGTEEANQQLETLANQIDEAVEQCLNENGLHAEKRKHQFFAHLTLGKFDPHATQLVDDSVRDANYPQQTAFTVNQIQITRSIQQENGANVYQREGTIVKLGNQQQTESNP